MKGQRSTLDYPKTVVTKDKAVRFRLCCQVVLQRDWSSNAKVWRVSRWLYFDVPQTGASALEQIAFFFSCTLLFWDRWCWRYGLLWSNPIATSELKGEIEQSDPWFFFCASTPWRGMPAPARARRGRGGHRVCFALPRSRFPSRADGALEEKVEIHLKYNNMFSLFHFFSLLGVSQTS